MKSLTSLILISCFFLLTSCGDESVTIDTGLTRYRGNGFEMQRPASWGIVDPATLSAPVSGRIELAVRSQVNTRGFMNNLLVLSDTLMTEVTSSEYARQSMNIANKQYLSVSIVREDALTFDDNGTSRVSIFHAKYNEVTEERLFMQTARVCGTSVYLLTL